MKAFKVYYEYPGADAQDIIICNNKDEIKDIIIEIAGYNRRPDKVEIKDVYEISFEKIYIRDLTAGNLLRLIGGNSNE